MPQQHEDTGDIVTLALNGEKMAPFLCYFTLRERASGRMMGSKAGLNTVAKRNIFVYPCWEWKPSHTQLLHGLTLHTTIRNESLGKKIVNPHFILQLLNIF
jgi:hypothetical protein